MREQWQKETEKRQWKREQTKESKDEEGTNKMRKKMKDARSSLDTNPK